MGNFIASRITEQHSILPLVLFRIGFGLLMLASTIRFAAKGWIKTLYVEPTFHFSYYGFSWIPSPSAPWLTLIFFVIGLSAIGIALGLFYRLSAASFFLLFTYVELLDKAYYLNHYYLVSLLSFLIIWLPLHHKFSVDAWRTPEWRRSHVPAWILFLLRGQLVLVYFFAGIAKLQSDWLIEAMPMKIWLSARVDLPLIGDLLSMPWSPYLMSWGGAIYDLTIPFLLLYRPTRSYALVAVIGFHGLTALLFPQIGLFPYLMMACSVLFISGEELSRGHGVEPPMQSRPLADSSTSVSSTQPLIAVFLSIILVLQLIIPIRHWLYPGDVLWTEEGFRYAWKVMLVEKSGRTIFMVTEPSSGRVLPIYPDAYLTPIQEAQMAYQPDMILAFAHFLEEEMALRGIHNAEVRAESYVSYNGRPSRLLIDPTVDLAKEPDDLWPKKWIVHY